MAAVWQRARSDEQREQRRSALLDAASRLLARKPLSEISLNAIAAEANITKSNVYRYFESREDVFLRLMLAATDAWCEFIIQRLGELEPGDDHRVARALTSATLENPTFARLGSVVATVLEHNVSADAVAHFKLAFLARVSAIVQPLGRVLPELGDDQVFQVLETAYYHLVAIWPSAHPPPEVAKALARPELEGACIDFEASLQQTIR
ncbi:MAG: TetR/AcrR family transcriptional regulator, partial [Myxococcota bacterium]